MKVLLTFDVEVWCGGWTELDSRFPRSFERYVYGRTSRGEYALPKTLEILNRYGLKGIFFVEPLFAARFGVQYLREIVSIISDAGHEVQLHIHPEWADEISPPPIPDVNRKRQHLSYYSLEEQTALIRFAMALMREAGAPRPTGFRAGSFAANASTFEALRLNGIGVDFSISPTIDLSVPDLRATRDVFRPQSIEGVFSLPMAVFRDGFSRLRHAQVGACSAQELTEAIESAAIQGWRYFVVLSHNFEMLKEAADVPDNVVVNRFERLCSFLASNHEAYVTAGVPAVLDESTQDTFELPAVSKMATLRRYAEQTLRRLG